jgi:hypothetical protein
MGRDKGGPYGREVSGSPPVPARSPPPTTAQDLTWVSFAAAQIFLSSAFPMAEAARCEGHFGTNPDLVLLAHARDVTHGHQQRTTLMEASTPPSDGTL